MNSEQLSRSKPDSWCNSSTQHLFIIFIMKNVLIHMKEPALDLIKELDLYWEYGDDEIDVTVPDIDYDPSHYYKDPDEQLCDHYGIDYDLVNCIELA